MLRPFVPHGCRYAEEPVPASRIGEHFKKQLDDSRRHHPGKILELYREYIDTEDHPDLDFLVDTSTSGQANTCRKCQSSYLAIRVLDFESDS